MISSIYAVLSPRDSNIVTHSFIVSSTDYADKECIDFVYRSMDKKYYYNEIISCFTFDQEVKDFWQRLGFVHLELQIPKTNKYRTMIYDLYMVKWIYRYNLPTICINGIVQNVPRNGHSVNPRYRVEKYDNQFQAVKSEKIHVSLIKSGNKLIDKNVQTVKILGK